MKQLSIGVYMFSIIECEMHPNTWFTDYAQQPYNGGQYK